MRQRVHGHESEEASVALDRVKGTEDGVERIRVVRLLFERQQRCLDLLQVISNFGVEFGQQLPVVTQRELHQGVRCGLRFGRGTTAAGSARANCHRGNRPAGLGCIEGARQPVDQTAQVFEGRLVKGPGGVKQRFDAGVHGLHRSVQSRFVGAPLGQLAQEAVGWNQTVVAARGRKNGFSGKSTKGVVQCLE